jgi:hypothetical protein
MVCIEYTTQWSPGKYKKQCYYLTIAPYVQYTTSSDILWPSIPYLLLKQNSHCPAPSMLLMQLKLITMRTETQFLILCLFTIDHELVEKKCQPSHLHALDALLGFLYYYRWYLVLPTLP